MKGMMVTLLMLGLTGTVNAQQFGSGDTVFGGSNPTRPTPEQSGFQSQDNGDSRSQNSKFWQLVLPLNPDIIENFRLKGEINARIDRREETGEVIFGFAKPLAEAKESTNFQNVEPIGRENGSLIFEFSDSDLKAVENSTLRYRFDSREIGQYDSIVIRLRGAQLNKEPYQPTTANDQFASNSPVGDIQPPIRDLRTRRDINPIDREDDQFSGTAGTGGRFEPSITPLPQGSRLGAVDPELEPRTDSWRTDLQRRSIGFDSPSVDPDQRAARLTQLQWEAELELREKRLAAKERELYGEQRLGQAGSTRLGTTGSAWNSGSTTSPFYSPNRPSSNPNSEDRYASLGMSLADQQPTGISPSSDVNLQNLTSYLHDEFNSLKQSNLDLNKRIKYMESQRFNDAQLVGANPQMTNGSLPDRDRLARNYQPTSTIASYRAEIPGNSRDIVTNQNMQGPLYFMLICSLGLNIYLGLISRNFYVRYNELADELRETFSASISN